MAAEESVEGAVKGFSEQVPQRHVYAADGSEFSAHEAEQGGSFVHLVPYFFDVFRIAAKQHAASEFAHDDFGRIGPVVRLADTYETGIGMEQYPAVAPDC